MHGSTSIKTLVETASGECAERVPQAISSSRIEALKVRELVSGIPRRMNGLERPGKKGLASMARQAIDLAQQTNASSISRWLSGAGKSLLPAGCCLLVGLFYLSAFFPKHHAWEAAAFIFVGLGVLAGLHHSTSVPAAVPFFFDDVLHVVLGTLSVQLAIRSGGMTAVQGAAMVGGLAWLSARIGLLDQRVLPASLYCGAFAGMTSSHLLPGISWVFLAGTITGIIYSLARHFWVGSAATRDHRICRYRAHRDGGSADGLESCGSCRFSHRWPLAVGGFWCSHRGRHRHFLVIGALQVLGGACLCHTLGHPGAGHQSVESGVAGQDAIPRGCVVRRELCRHDVDGAPRRPVLDAALVGLDFRSPVRWFRSRVHGFGGLLGITALVSVMAALGLARWWPTNAISSAKNV